MTWNWLWVLFLVPVTACGIYDFLSMRVPNRLTVPLIFIGLAYRAWAGDFWGGLSGALVWFIAGAVLVSTGGMGGGDVKLMAAIGAWAGVYGGLLVFAAASLIGAAWAAAKLARLGLLKRKILYLLYWGGSIFTGVRQPLLVKMPEEGVPQEAIPFAACLAAGVWAATLAAWYVRHYSGIVRW
ncbi:Type IV leader peptidase family protein [Neomoorella glycerini]|uniref:Type IV leader peptidase family protein n=1 Tax=Neomoorella glycerini TaxID=55779 RepID=A0A6I5ZTY7_9FIRM|nr:A24 family peptidase [Moorella glycerini]QGP93384.1 Type IV leader peptidase family protein [Moorella glycerini]